MAASDAKEQAVAQQVWGRPASAGRRTSGGRRHLSRTLCPRPPEAEGVASDVDPPSDNIVWAHQSAEVFPPIFRFRGTGRAPDLWDATSGDKQPAGYELTHASTVVRVTIYGYHSRFAAFRRHTAASHARFDETQTVLGPIEGPWSVAFSGRQGVPLLIIFNHLISWTDHANAGVRYYSGRAAYAQSLRIDADWIAPGRRVQLDVGAVREIAHARNGSDLGAAWRAPNGADITPALRPGANRLEIEVNNYRVNRMMGALQPGAYAYVFASLQPFFTASAPLAPSSLWGAGASAWLARGGAAIMSTSRRCIASPLEVRFAS